MVTAAQHHLIPDPSSAVIFEQVRLARGSRVVLDDVNLHLPVGKVTAILGPSGAGKSTLLHAITGELAPARGTLRVLDHA